MERRSQPRHDLWIPVLVDGLREGIAVTHNASDKGVLLVAASRIEVGQKVTLTFRNIPGFEQPLVVMGTVVRSGDNTEDPEGLWPYSMGLELEEPLPELERLRRAVMAEEPAE